MAELVYSFMFPLLFVDGRLIKLKTGKQSLEAKEDFKLPNKIDSEA